MTNQLDLNNYKQQIADLYNRRSETYDNSEWHLKICQRLIEYALFCSGQHILDIATGTGHIAIAASQIVGSEGKVVGIDISAGMLEQTKQKVEKLGLQNIEFQLADAELLSFPKNSFDRILCANSFPWIENKQAALQQWIAFLKPGGIIAIHTPADTSDVGYVVLRSVLAKYGVIIEPSNRIGTIETCKNLFANAGFEGIEIKTEQHGNYINIDIAKARWAGNSFPSPNQTANPFSQLSPIQLAEAKTEFETELKALQTESGIWDDLTTLYIIARKPEII